MESDPIQPSSDQMIRDVLKQTINSTPMTGGEYVCYNFPSNITGLEPYLLRVRKEVSYKDKFCDLLNSTTSLTPIKPLLGGTNVGQPLMQLGENEDVTIVLRQSGKSFLDICQNPENTTTDPRILLFEKIIAIQEKTGINPFVRAFEHSYALGKRGFTADFDIANVFLDDESSSIVLIDQLNRRKLGAASCKDSAHYFDDEIMQLTRNFGTNDVGGTEKERYQIARELYINMINEAALYVSEHPPHNSSLGFAKVTDTSAIALKDPPKTLVTQLDQLRQEALQPAR